MNRAAACIAWMFVSCAVMMSPRLSVAQTSEPGSRQEQMHAPAPVSASLTLTIDGKATTLSVAELQAMPQKTVNVHNEHTKADESYTGVLLGDLLAKYGFPVSQATHRKMLRSYLVAEGTDKYWVLYSVTEVEGSEHDANVIVATAMNGKPLGEDGQLKLIDSGDKKPQRWVRNLTAITVKSAE
ncbi:MAG: molybdopterin-dependent oxidoreductase [Edaphobacter sp.]